MSREAFVPPTLINAPGSNPGAGAVDASGAALNDNSKPVRYRCGECNSIVQLRRQDVVRCHECGHRVLYKERTKRCVFRLLRVCDAY